MKYSQNKKNIVIFYVSSNGFGNTKTLVQLNHLQKVVDRSNTDDGDIVYRLQSFMDLHLMALEFLLQIIVTPKEITKFYEMVISLILLLSVEQYEELFCLYGSYWSIKMRVTIVLNSV